MIILIKRNITEFNLYLKKQLDRYYNRYLQPNQQLCLPNSGRIIADDVLGDNSM